MGDNRLGWGILQDLLDAVHGMGQSLGFSLILRNLHLLKKDTIDRLLIR
jgi:hypothetical protein